MVSVFLTLTFLAHQALISADAVLRTFYRRLVSRQRLLEWETAAEAETGHRQAHLRRCSAELDAGGGADRRRRSFTASHRHALYDALPILCSVGDQQAGVAVAESAAAAAAQEHHACRTSASCAAPRCTSGATSPTFSNAEHNWLIPDNVQEEPARIAARLSPTNLGFLFNARQVAVRVRISDRAGVRGADAFARWTRSQRLPKDHGHFYNWYDTRTLEALTPALHLDRGQRQPGGFAHHLEGRLPRLAAAAAAESGAARWLRRSSLRAGRAESHLAEDRAVASRSRAMCIGSIACCRRLRFRGRASERERGRCATGLAEQTTNLVRAGPPQTSATTCRGCCRNSRRCAPMPRSLRC